MFGIDSLAVSTAKMLRNSSLLDSWLMVVVKIFAFTLSSLSFAAGVLVYGIYQVSTIKSTPEKIGVMAFFIVMGLGAAMVCESLTIANCKKLVHKLQQYAATKERQAKIVDVSQMIKDAKQRQLSDITSAITSYSIAIALTSIISFIGGMLFWHYTLSGTGEIVSWVASTAFSLLVSIALVYSTLSHDDTIKVVDTTLDESNFIQKAIQSDMLVQLGVAYGRKMSSVLENTTQSDDMQALTQQSFYTLADRFLSAGDGRISQHLQDKQRERIKLEQEAMQQLDTSWVPTPGGILIPKTNVRRDKERNLQRLEVLIKERGIDKIKDALTDGSLEDELGIAKSTIYRYLEELVTKR